MTHNAMPRIWQIVVQGVCCVNVCVCEHVCVPSECVYCVYVYVCGRVCVCV